jgi:hypothetical protein
LIISARFKSYLMFYLLDFPFQLLIFGLGTFFCWFRVIEMMIAVDAVLTGGCRTVVRLSGR